MINIHQSRIKPDISILNLISKFSLNRNEKQLTEIK